jgi:hypothetical protein
MQEIFLPFRHATLPIVTEVRSTIVVSAIQTLRARGIYERYLDSLPAPTRDRIVSLIAGIWVPIDLAVEHYRAMDRLGLETATIEAIGGEVADRVNKSVLSLAVTLSKQVGATPWRALSVAHKVNDINWRGGDIQVTKLGPKEARYEWAGQPCAAVPYFVTAFGGFLRSLASLFAVKVYTRLAPERSSLTSVSYRISWV